MSHVDTSSPITHVSLCAGYGGIDLGLRRVLPALRTIAYAEREGFCCANLVSKAEAGLMDAAPIWTDVKTFPWAEFRDRVDILSGGYPCQPFSAAGKRLGAEDPRHLWPHISAGIAAMRPAVCFFENVEGHISLGLPDVIEDLAGLGYRTTWGIFSASEVGAPHQRKRVFILAHRNESGWQARWHNAISSQGRQPHELAACGGDQGGAEELALTSSLGSAAGVPRPHQGHEAIAGVADHCGDQAWPSRPGEQQFAWEPPRVVVDAKSQRAGQRSELRSEECGSRSALSWDVEQSGEGFVANDHSAHAGHGEQRPERTLGDLSGGCGEAMEHANRADAGQNAGADCCGEQAHQGQMGCCDEHWQSDGSDGDAAMGNEGNLDEQLIEPAHTSQHAGLDNAEGIGWQESGYQQGSAPQSPSRRQTQPPLGRDADGPADWLHDAELYTTCDNRTDELRLLGNGVVPATAERAFRTLVSELIEHANP